ncbi:MAG: cytoskeleton protein RodZ [Alteromonadaceae bacterium]|jgi:cytoskeleton protein RodZ
MKQQVAMTEETLENAEVLTPGFMLSEARVSLRLTPLDIAKKLNLREALILAIEENEYDEMTSVTFTRGYLKAYAKLVRVSQDDILAAFEYWNNAEQQQLQMQSFSQDAKQRALDNRWLIFSYLVVFVILVLVVVYWFQRNESDSDVDKAPVINTQVSSPQTTTVAKQQNETIVSDQQSDTGEEGSPGVSTLQSNEQSDPAIEAATITSVGDRVSNRAGLSDATAEQKPQSTSPQDRVAQQRAAAEQEQIAASTELDHQIAAQLGTQEAEGGPGKSHLELRFSDSCWINIADANGERIAIGTKVRGHLTSVYALAPFTIKLGKPDVVSIWLDGEQQTIPYYPKGRIANFQLAAKTTDN